MRMIAVVVIFAFSAGVLMAQDAKLEASCKSSKTPYIERIKDCDTLLESGEYDDQAWFFERRGDTYKDNQLYQKAIPEFTRSLEIDPEHWRSLEGRALIYYGLNNYDLALADTARLLELDPDKYWNTYFYGKVLASMGRDDEAKDFYTKSIAQKDDYYRPWWYRAFVHLRAKNSALAVADFERVKQLEPLWIGPYKELYKTHYDGGDIGLAAHNFLIAQTIDPNFRVSEGRKNELIQLGQVPALAPLTYNAPRQGLSVQFLQVILPRETRSEMELAIQGIADWFQPAAKAMPEAKAMITRTLRTDGDRMTVGLKTDAEYNMEKFMAPGAIPPESVETFRGLFTSEFRPRGVEGPVFQITHEGADPAVLWPLEVGKEVVGHGRLLLMCPKTFQFESMVLGCRIGMKEVHMGTLDYSLYVEKTEQIYVPLGYFDTYVVRYRELSTSMVGAKKIKREVETKWWIAPDLNFWVKRTTQMGDKVSSSTAIGMGGG